MILRRPFCRPRLKIAPLVLLAGLACGGYAAAQTAPRNAADVAPQSAPERGTISGKVTADQGAVRGFRVTAHNLQYRVWYTVFTKNGQYTVPQALPGPYEVSVVEDRYTSPVQKIDLAAKQSATADIAVTQQPPPAGVTYLDYDQLYPPGPERQLLEKTCQGCHNRIFYHLEHRNEEGWRAAVRKMRWGVGRTFPQTPLGRTQLSAKDVDTIVSYLTKNFGPDSPNRDLKLDPIPVDEEAMSKAIYVSYDIPPDTPAPMKNIALQDALVAHDRSIWFTVISSAGALRLEPLELDPAKRWKFFATPRPFTLPHGITENSKGHMFLAELVGGQLAEIDPVSGKVTEHEVPSRGGVHSVITDPQDNIWYTEYLGSTMGKLDAKTNLVSDFATITPDSAPYGLIQDLKGNIWALGTVASDLIKFDPVAEVYTEYKIPTPAAGPRRIRLDSKGMIWFTETNTGKIGTMNPQTGVFREYVLPLRNVEPYELWLDKRDEGIVWWSDQVNNTLTEFDIKKKKYTYFPLPELNWDIAKVELEPNNTVWIATRPVPGRKMTYQAGVHFYPTGYSASAPPQP